MSLSEKFDDEIQVLRTLRDELRVQMNLAHKEAHDLYETAEKKWDSLEAKLEHIKDESAEALHDVGQAASVLADEIRDAYRRIRAEL